MSKRIIVAGAAITAALTLTACSSRPEGPREPSQPAWFTTVAPSGRSVECLWVGDYGGVSALSFQAEMQCWDLAHD